MSVSDQEIYAQAKPTFKNLSVCRYMQRAAGQMPAAPQAPYITKVLIPFECSGLKFDDTEQEDADVQDPVLDSDSDSEDSDSEPEPDVSDACSAFSD